MMDEMANHATRIRRYVDRYGIDTVEDFVDKCLSIEGLIDRHSQYVEPKITPSEPGQSPNFMLKYEKDICAININPPDFVKEQRNKHANSANAQILSSPGSPSATF